MRFEVQRNDIAAMEVDVIVLPANSLLRTGPGASLAIFEAAGRQKLEAECSMRYEQVKKSGIRLVPGVSVPTLAYNLPAKVILHTIVPKWQSGNARRCYEDLCKSYASALVLADEMGMTSVAFPMLASGNNGFDTDVAIDVALQSLRQYQPKHKLEVAYLVTFDSKITQKLRDRGFEVEEAIDQVHVLEQDVHQAEVHKEDKQHHQKAIEQDKPFILEKIDDAIDWIKVPQNLQAVLGFAIAVADIALPKAGMGAKVLKVLKAATPLIEGGKK